MALRFRSRDLRGDLGTPDSRTAYSSPPTSQGGSGNGARGRKMMEVERLLANLEKEGVEINDKICRIIDDEVARIEAEAARKNINKPKMDGLTILLDIATVAVGFMMGAEWCDNAIRAAVANTLLFG